MFTGPLFQINYINLVLSYPVDLKAPRELWNPLSKAVPGKFNRYGGHSKRNCLQDRSNSQVSRTWQIILFFEIHLKTFEIQWRTYDVHRDMADE